MYIAPQASADRERSAAAAGHSPVQGVPWRRPFASRGRSLQLPHVDYRGPL
jgi:hypothetical protein